MTCRTCQHYAVQPDADGKVRMRKNGVSRCAAPIPDISHLLPKSVTTAHDWRPPLKGRYMQPDEGKDCPLHVTKARAPAAMGKSDG